MIAELLLAVTQVVGFSPLTVRVKVRLPEVQEVCIVIDGPEYHSDCFTPRGLAVVKDYVVYAGGEYYVFAISGKKRTPEVTVRVKGIGEGDGGR